MAITTGAQFGHYRILTLLGVGDMGEVYLAERRHLYLKLKAWATTDDDLHILAAAVAPQKAKQYSDRCSK